MPARRFLFASTLRVEAYRGAVTDLPTNGELAADFQLLGDLLQIDGADRHRVLAYHRGAARIRATNESVAAMAVAGRATDLPDIGATLQSKMVERCETGQISALAKLTERLPAGLADLARIEGLGPKRARAIWEHIGVSNLTDLAAAAEDGRLATVPGVGPKLVAVVTEQAAAPEAGERRTLLALAVPLAESFLETLRATPGVVAADVAGSLRRGRETIGDVDIIVATTDPDGAAEAFVAHPAVARVTVSGPSKIAVVTQNGLKVELRVGPPESYGNMLQHCTGSKAHNIRIRERAVAAGMSVSEHGLTGADGVTTTHPDEEALYAALGLPWIPPELREDLGELDGPVPNLVTLADIRGDLHSHSDWSDGRATIEEMAAAAAARGYAYLGVTDHSHSLAMVGGLDAERAKRQWEVIDGLNDRGDLGVRLLKGVELEILTDGRLDFDDELLAGFDVVVASIHSGFRQTPREVTARLLAAIENENVDIIGHPTGRRIGRRPPLVFDTERVFARAAQTGTLMEINGSGERLDLNDQMAREAKAAGCRFVISSDAHHPGGLGSMRLGVTTARRAGLPCSDVANAEKLWSP